MRVCVKKSCRYARAAVRAGVADYLLKPLQDAELHAILDKLARKRRSEGTQDRQPVAVQAAADPPLHEEDPSILVQRARDYIQRNFSKPISLNEVANALNVNPAYLSSVFKSERILKIPAPTSHGTRRAIIADA